MTFKMWLNKVAGFYWRPFFMMVVNKKNPLWILLILFLGIGVYGYFERDLWFDEALTLLNFAILPSAEKIYHSYVIPNNQILYSIILHFWLKLTPHSGLLDWHIRILSLLFGAVNLIILLRSNYQKFSHNSLLFALLALGCSPIYLNYATAVRGYMLSMLFITISLWCGKTFYQSKKCGWSLAYMAGCLGAVATLPSNLLPLAAVVLYIIREYPQKFYRSIHFYILSFIPIIMFIVFYFPIRLQLFNASQLGEGWSNGSEVLMVLALSQIFIFGPLLLWGLYGAIRKKSNFFTIKFMCTILIWLLPVPAVYLLKVAPFPRVFFPLFPIFTLLVASGIKSAFAKTPRSFRPRAEIALITITILWIIFSQLPPWKNLWSKVCGNSGRDDFFYSHYLRSDFTPRKTAEQICRDYPQTTTIYHSFSSDPWATMYYLQLLSPQTIRSYFDGPRGKITALPDQTLVVLRRNEDVNMVTKRFGGYTQKLFSNSMHEVYLWQK